MSKERKKAIKRLDKVWGQIIHLRDKQCQICGKIEGTNAHHICTKSRMNTRFDLENGILLCCYHHTLSKDMSAHKAHRNFDIWLINKKGKKWLDTLEHRSQIDAHGLDLKLIEIYLKLEYDKFKKMP